MSADNQRPESVSASPDTPAFTNIMLPESPIVVDPRLQTEAAEPQQSPSPAATKKRASAGTAGTGDQPQKVTKRRAAKACSTCRARKVRCDVTERVPCSNCTWDKIKCVVQESRRRKKHAPGVPQFAPRPPNPPPLASAPGAPFMPMAAYGGLPGQVPLPPHPGFNMMVPRLTVPPQLSVNVPVYAPVAPSPFGLPDFIAPMTPGRLRGEDLEYLQRKGCFDLPAVPFRRKLIRAYVEHVHPTLPVLDIHWFLEVMSGHRPGGRLISLLLFQAVMFAASTFVEAQDVQAAGYPSRAHARQALFERAKYLDMLEYEPDKLVMVQSLLLMSYWYATPTETRDTWHYSGIALSLAFSLNLHRDRDVAQRPGVDAIQAKLQKRLEKRIWWCCVARDRLIALGMRRPTRVRDEDHNMPKPTEDDFEYRAVAGYDQVGDECDVAANDELQRRLALNFIELVNLSEIIYQMLRSQYSILAPTGPHMVGPRDALDPVHQAEALEVDDKLNKWYDGLKDWQRSDAMPPPGQPANRTTLIMATHRILLNMLGQTTKGGLWRPFFALELRAVKPGDALPTSGLLQDLQRKAKEVVPEAADNITRMTQELQNYHLVRFLPTFAVTALLPTLFIHMLHVKDKDPDVRNKAVKGYQVMKIVLKELAEVYAAASYGLRIAEHLCSQAGVLNDQVELAAVVQPQATMMNHDNDMTPPPDGLGLNFGSKIDLNRPAMYFPPPVDESTPPSSGEDTPMWGHSDTVMGGDLGGWQDEAGDEHPAEGLLNLEDMDEFLQFEPGGEVPAENMPMFPLRAGTNYMSPGLNGNGFLI